MSEAALIDGRYRLERLLHAEGSAEAWLAYDHVLDRRVVVEVLRTDLRRDPTQIAAFGEQVRGMARAGVVDGHRLLDAGDDASVGTPFAVLEWVDDEPAPAAADAAATRLIQTTAAPPTRVAAAPARRRRRARRLPIWPIVLVLAVVAIALGLRLAPSVGRLGSDTAAGGSVPTAQPTASPLAAATRVPTTATAAVAAQRRRIANTDGQGVALRASPGGARLPGHGYDEGDTVTLLEQSGEWAHIRGDDGREGWVLAVTLVPV
jgi:Bacterial SH3 domain